MLIEFHTQQQFRQVKSETRSSVFAFKEVIVLPKAILGNDAFLKLGCGRPGLRIVNSLVGECKVNI